MSPTETRSTCPYCGVGCGFAYGDPRCVNYKRRSLSLANHG